MNKSKIPISSRSLGMSLIPKPVKDKKITTEQENKPLVKFPSKLQAHCLKSKLSAVNPATSISKVTVDKTSKEVLFNHKLKKNLSECPKTKVIKKPKLVTSKIQAVSKPIKKSTSEVSTNIVKRLPINCNQQDKYRKENFSKTESKQKINNQKPQTIKDSVCLRESNPVMKVHRITLKDSIKDKAITPIKLKKSESNSDENDAEFQASGFYKKLILAEKELSPEIIKLCENKNFSSMLAHMDSPEKILLMKNPSADHLVEDLKRNSAMFHRLKGLQHSPYWSDKESPFKKTPCRSFSVKPNLEMHDLVRQVRRESELKNIGLEKSCLGSFNPKFRHWTTNTPRKFIVSADTVRRLSEMRKDCGLPISNKCIKPATCYQLECLNPHKRVLRELNNLTTKKKVKGKKKVTFDIPKSSPTIIEISKATSNKLKDELTTILENSSKNSTPEFNSNMSKDSKPKDIKEICENLPQVTTPELHLNSCRINASLLPVKKECGYEQESETKITTPEFDLKTSHCLYVHNVQNLQFCTNNKDSLDSSPLDVHFKKLQISSKHSENENIVISDVSHSIKNLHSTSKIDLETFNSSFKDSVHIPTTCLMQTMENAVITSISERLNQAKEYYSIFGKNIYTPHPISFYSNSKSASDGTPLLLTGKSTDICAYVPIYTPYALKSLAEKERSNPSPVCQRLQFKDESELSTERRESQIYIQKIPTLQKTYDYLCDQECSIFSSQSTNIQLTRNLKDPVASILSEGDQMHFLPLCLS